MLSFDALAPPLNTLGPDQPGSRFTRCEFNFGLANAIEPNPIKRNAVNTTRMDVSFLILIPQESFEYAHAY